MKLKIILVRHGYSTTNASGVNTGQMDAPLSDVGHVQAKLLSDHLEKAYHIDAIYASDLSRAVDTVRPTAERLGLPLHTDAALRELDVGEWAGVAYDEVKVRFATDHAAYQKSIDAPCTGGESVRDAAKRLFACIDRIAREWDGKTVLICSHAICCRLFAALAATGSIENVRAYAAPNNASCSVYEYEDGTPRAILQNYTAHLDNDTTTALSVLV